MSRTTNYWIHDPNAVLDYVVDWTDWLDDGETIASHDIEVETGDVVLDSDSVVGAKTVAWVSGGTTGTSATVRHRVTTSAGRVDDRTITLSVRER